MKRRVPRAVRVVVPLLLCALAALRAGGTEPLDREGILVNADGMTLYVFDRDVPHSGRSACVGHCTRLWEPAVAPQETAGATQIASDTGRSPFSVMVREDGTRQWVYRGRPLYLYAGDRQPGDRRGDEFKNVWHVVKR